ncbi:hypothetical protein BST81_01285 [Leptolyngbya sp. 'hensonii']|uniref:hypothetical protein n=1 Tax=Leptolyngbya sp. 'hensonii' TaxID=1922337 RepID=UPI00094F9FA6|nr:hypothetical protein [Leptolyngbya sp. 'hensonii']OLP20389.1 hypothetical protein BST81_01285 [Leptolyngbya sp. 'hensonii']
MSVLPQPEPQESTQLQPIYLKSGRKSVIPVPGSPVPKWLLTLLAGLIATSTATGLSVLLVRQVSGQYLMTARIQLDQAKSAAEDRNFVRAARPCHTTVVQIYLPEETQEFCAPLASKMMDAAEQKVIHCDLEEAIQLLDILPPQSPDYGQAKIRKKLLQQDQEYLERHQHLARNAQNRGDWKTLQAERLKLEKKRAYRPCLQAEIQEWIGAEAELQKAAQERLDRDRRSLLTVGMLMAFAFIILKISF